MKLNTEQTQNIFNYVASFDIKYYELQVEFTDHMVTSMEEIWEKDPVLTFDQVKLNAANKFVGDSSFKSIEEERKRILQKEYRKVQWKMITEYLKFPKIIGSILLVYLAYTFSAYFSSPQKYLAVLFCSLLIIGLPVLYYCWKTKEIDGKHFLTLETLKPSLEVFSFPNLGMGMSNLLEQELLQYQWLVVLFCCIWVLGILISVTAIHLQKKTIENIKKQYQLN
jgi:protein-S-isoprenylcysteine O-methyltransferase Ste14